MILLIAFILLVLIIIKTSVKPRNFPPGPTWLSFLGSSYAVKSYRNKYGSQHSGLEKMAADYKTSVLGLKLDRQEVVVVFGEENVRRVFKGEEFEGRPDTYFMQLRCFGKRSGITAMDGPEWKELRSFTLKHLRNVGFGQASMEEQILGELEEILSIIKFTKGGINPRKLLAPFILNVLWRFAAGENMQKDDERLRKLLSIMDNRSKAFTMSGNVLNEMPWIRFVAPQLSGYSLITHMNHEISHIIQGSIQKHKDGIIKENDFVYEFLEAIRKSPDTYSEEQLMVIILDLFIGGSQTTSASLDFAILMMLKNEIIQKKVHQEIDKVVGGKRLVWQDISSLPYTQAVMYEVQRFFTIVPFTGPRRTLRDTVLDGYTIPKDSTILIGTYSVHHDEKIWGDPENFRPERFIDGDGNLTMTEHLYHFGLGRRRCLGEVLAKYCLFLIFAGIMQKFSVKQCGDVEPSIIPVPGMTHCAQNYLAEFVSRV